MPKSLSPLLRRLAVNHPPQRASDTRVSFITVELFSQISSYIFLFVLFPRNYLSGSPDGKVDERVIYITVKKDGLDEEFSVTLRSNLNKVPINSFPYLCFVIRS